MAETSVKLDAALAAHCATGKVHPVMTLLGLGANPLYKQCMSICLAAANGHWGLIAILTGSEVAYAFRKEWVHHLEELEFARMLAEVNLHYDTEHCMKVLIEGLPKTIYSNE